MSKIVLSHDGFFSDSRSPRLAIAGFYHIVNKRSTPEYTV
jgi:hypothetical protein